MTATVHGEARVSPPDELVLPVEPLRLKCRLRRLLGEEPERARTQIPRSLARSLARSWRDPLASRGCRPADLSALLLAYGREEWLWVIGDRTWQQTVEGLRGRIVRRFPGS